MAVLLGNPIKFSVLFTDEDGDLIDPSVVTFVSTPETGEGVSYTYGVDAELVRDSEGAYHVWTTPEAAGEYRGDFRGSGNLVSRGCAKVEMTDECDA